MLCGPLVAGCGAATRIDFASHSRPASPIDVSVYVGTSGITVDPTTLSPGPVEFNITNQSGRAVSLAVIVSHGRALSHGRTLRRSPSILAGGTAQIKATLSHANFGIGFPGQPSSMKRLTLSGRARTGDNALTQP